MYMEHTAQDFYNYLSSGNTTLFGGIVYIICIVGWWKLFEKAGFSGILSIIPVVNLFVLSKIAYGSYLYGLLAFIPIVNIFYALALNYQIMRCFGCGMGLSIIGAFFPVLALFPAFGDNVYLGPKK